MKRIIIISILLIFPRILFADSAWLLWRYWTDVLDVYKEKGSWSLINALNSRNECLDALLNEHIRFYESYLDDPNYEVIPKPDDVQLICLHLFFRASKAEPVSEDCKTVITHFIFRSTNKQGINSELRLDYADEKARQLLEEARKMQKDGKTSDQVNAYLKAPDFYKKISKSKVHFWCLPVGVDPKTIQDGIIK